MNRREFFRVLGAGALAVPAIVMKVIEPQVEQPPAIGSETWWELQGVTTMRQYMSGLSSLNFKDLPEWNGVAEHTHELPPYPTTYTIFNL
jgi:hypothetical protein